jgi:hypothetical protein
MIIGRVEKVGNIYTELKEANFHYGEVLLSGKTEVTHAIYKLFSFSTHNLSHWNILYLGHAQIQLSIFQPITQIQLTARHI